MWRRSSVLILVVAACTSPDPSVTPAADPALAMSAAAPDEAAVARGEIVYQNLCSQCHSLQPPPMLAPPLSHIAREYRAKLDGDGEVVTRMVEWVLRPDPQRSLLPSHAIDRFGLMPAQVLTERELRDVAAYILELEPEEMGGGGMQVGGGGMAGPVSHAGPGRSGMRMPDSMMPHRMEGPGGMQHEGMVRGPMTGQGGHGMQSHGAAPAPPPPE